VSSNNLNRQGSSKDEFDNLRDELRRKLRDALPSLKQPELRRDLWPLMLRRLEKPPAHIPWLDWALLALTGATLALFPALIPALLYHF
jgi:hypothetical protein